MMMEKMRDASNKQNERSFEYRCFQISYTMDFNTFSYYYYYYCSCCCCCFPFLIFWVWFFSFVPRSKLIRLNSFCFSLFYVLSSSASSFSYQSCRSHIHTFTVHSFDYNVTFLNRLDQCLNSSGNDRLWMVQHRILNFELMVSPPYRLPSSCCSSEKISIRFVDVLNRKCYCYYATTFVSNHRHSHIIYNQYTPPPSSLCMVYSLFSIFKVNSIG